MFLLFIFLMTIPLFIVHVVSGLIVTFGIVFHFYPNLDQGEVGLPPTPYEPAQIASLEHPLTRKPNIMKVSPRLKLTALAVILLSILLVYNRFVYALTSAFFTKDYLRYNYYLLPIPWIYSIIVLIVGIWLTKLVVCPYRKIWCL